MRTLIVNADDFGLAKAVNAGIEQAHRTGILTSATLMANGPAFDDAVARAKALPNLGVGIHLNLLRGNPVAVASRIAALLGPDGRMHGGFLSMGMRCRKADFLNAAAIEYRAQIEKCLSTGLTITHTDSEKHHAAWPRLTALVEKLSAEYGILAIRRPGEAVAFSARRLPWNGVKKLGAAAFLRAVVQMRKTVLRTTDHFFGQTHIGGMTVPVWRALLAHLPDGVTEVMVHPGLADETEMSAVARDMGSSWIDGMRPVECAALSEVSVVGAATAGAIRLAHYGMLASSGA